MMQGLSLLDRFVADWQLSRTNVSANKMVPWWTDRTTEINGSDSGARTIIPTHKFE
jgi:hypothetical protein